MYLYACSELWCAATRHIVHGRHGRILTLQQHPIAFALDLSLSALVVVALTSAGFMSLWAKRYGTPSSRRLDRILDQRTHLDEAKRQQL